MAVSAVFGSAKNRVMLYKEDSFSALFCPVFSRISALTIASSVRIYLLFSYRRGNR